VTLTVVDDSQNAADVTVDLDLQNLQDGTGGNVSLTTPDDHEVTIVNDEVSTFTIDDVVVNEAAGTATFTVSLDIALDIAVIVDVSYADVSASGLRIDYDSASDQATFSAGSTTSQPVTVAITNDLLVEGNESFTASLSTATALGGRNVDLSDTGTGTMGSCRSGGRISPCGADGLGAASRGASPSSLDRVC